MKPDGEQGQLWHHKLAISLYGKWDTGTGEKDGIMIGARREFLKGAGCALGVLSFAGATGPAVWSG